MSLLLRNVGWKTGAVAIEKGLRLVLIAVVARTLGKEAYGQFTYAAAVSLLAVQATDLGLGLWVAREIARSGRVDAGLVGQALTAKAVLAGVYALAMVAVAAAHTADPWVAWTVALAAVSALAVSGQEIACQVFRGLQKLEIEARVTSTWAAAQLGLTLAALLVWHGAARPAGLRGALVAVAGAGAVAALVGAGVAARLLLRVVVPVWGLTRAQAGVLARDVLPLGVAIVASLVYFKIDVPMLRWLTNDAEVGTYNAAYKLLEVGAVVPATLMAAAFPALSAALAERPADAVRLFRRVLVGLIALGSVVGGVLFLTPEWIVWLLYGDGYAASADVLRALAPSVLLTWINYLLTHMLVALGRVRAQAAIACVLVAVNVGLNLVWMPSYGGVGAALATLATEACLLAACIPLLATGLRARLTAVGGSRGP